MDALVFVLAVSFLLLSGSNGCYLIEYVSLNNFLGLFNLLIVFVCILLIGKSMRSSVINNILHLNALLTDSCMHGHDNILLQWGFIGFVSRFELHINHANVSTIHLVHVLS